MRTQRIDTGHGQCQENGTCDCDPGWRGVACDLFSCDGSNDCSGNGECVDVNTCQCYVGYYGKSCNEMITCPSVRNCSRNGVCVDNSTCVCYGGYFGNLCDQFECTQGCSGRGTCEGPDICSCILGWTGFDCSVPSCEQLHYCSGQLISVFQRCGLLSSQCVVLGNGRCVGPKTCDCDDNWTEPWCNVFTCTSNNRTGNCSHHGNCTAPGWCTCQSDFCGEDCQYPGTVPPLFARTPHTHTHARASADVIDFPIAIDECTGMTGNDVTSPCSHICTDTCESYECSCRPGYMLQENGRSCQGQGVSNSCVHTE